MRFNNGYFGACVVVLAILGTALGGFVLSLERTVEPVTNFNYITDVSGLFSYTNEPEYIDYNPSSNFVGYTADTGTPHYEQTDTANNYRYIVSGGNTESITTVTQTRSDGANDYGQFAGRLPSYPDFVFVRGSLNDTYPFFPTGATKLSTFVSNNISNLENYTKIIIDISNSGDPLLIYSGNWVYSEAMAGAVTTYRYNAEFTTLNSQPTKIEINTASMIATAYRGSTVIYSTSVENIGIFTNVESDNGVYFNINSTLTISGVVKPTYAYMNPTWGVRIDWDSHTPDGRYAIDWTNGYENNTVTFKVSGTRTQELEFVAYHGNTGGTRVSLLWGMTNNLNLYYPDGNGGTTRVDLGIWPAVQVTLNATANTISFTPTQDASLLSVVDEMPYTQTITGFLPDGDIESIKFSYYRANTYPAFWQITNTTVFLDTYNTVMKDPTIDIQTYFPGMDEYRLNFYAFALYGNSITINGNTGTVDRSSGLVTFTINGQTVTHPLKNIYVSVDDGHTYLTFANIGKTYDLGETTSHTVSFSGYWYFTTGLYEPVEGLQTVYVWDLDGTFHANAGQCLIIFLGIMALCVLVGKTFGGVNVRIFDWLVMIFAGFLAFSILGGMIV